MDKRRFPALQASNRNLEEPAALHTLESLPSQARASRIGDDVAYGVDRPGFRIEQSRYESGIPSPPSQPPQQAPSCERSQERNTAPTNVLAGQKSRDALPVPLGSQFSNLIVIPGEISSGKMPAYWKGVSADIETAPSGPNLLDPGLFELYEDFEAQPISMSSWEVKPINYSATCNFDRVFLDLILLNPKQHSFIYPMAAEIVSVSDYSIILISQLTRIENYLCFHYGLST
jgi:hypothetical protein